VLGLIFEEEPEYCIQVSPDVFASINPGNGTVRDPNAFFPSFPELSLFPKILKWLDESSPDSIEKIDKVSVDQSPWQPIIQEGAITGRVLYIDSYNNAISNISLKLFNELHHGKRFEIFVKSNHYRIDKISQTYEEADPGDLIALFNSVGFLEIAMVQAPVGDLLSLEQGSTIKIKFYE
jgi:S-adenosylmethionine hydrolase